MRDYRNLDLYLDVLAGDIYPQPPDPGHISMAEAAINQWVGNLMECKTVLDVGCGQGIAAPMLQNFGLDYTGVTLGNDYAVCRSHGLKVYNMDFHFLDFPDNSFDLILSRHSLEHSPMPLLALMEWFRVSKSWLMLILPNAEHYGWAGLNHYSVLHPNQAEFLLDKAGWHIIWSDFEDKSELRYMCEKIRSSHYERYVQEHGT